jgi:hypothetical protein
LIDSFNIQVLKANDLQLNSELGVQKANDDLTLVIYSLPDPYIPLFNKIMMDVNPPVLPCKCVTFEKNSDLSLKITVDNTKIKSKDEGNYKIGIKFTNLEDNKTKDYEIMMNLKFISTLGESKIGTVNIENDN